MRHSPIVALAFTAVLATAAPALARPHGHGGHHGGHPHYGGHARFGGFHHGGPRFFAGHRGWHPRPAWRTYGVVRHHWRPGYAYAYGAPVYYHRPVGGCSTTRRVGFTPYGWRKIVTTRTCIVP